MLCVICFIFHISDNKLFLFYFCHRSDFSKKSHGKRIKIKMCCHFIEMTCHQLKLLANAFQMCKLTESRNITFRNKVKIGIFFGFFFHICDKCEDVGEPFCHYLFCRIQWICQFCYFCSFVCLFVCCWRLCYPAAQSKQILIKYALLNRNTMCSNK